MKKIIYLTNKFGTGHYHTVEAIQEALDARYPGKFSHKTVDLYKVANTKVYNGHIKLNNFLAGYAKPVYKWSHKLTDQNEKYLYDTAYLAFGKKFWKVIEPEKPDIILSASPFFVRSIAKMLANVGSKAILGEIITDLGRVHRAWMYPKLDFYLSPSEETTFHLLKNSVSKEKIKTLGFPVRQQFYKSYNLNSLRKKYRLSKDKKTILIFSGGYALGRVGEKIKEIASAIKNYQFLIICGTNQKLCKEMKKILRNSNGNKITVFGYVQNVAELMAVSDLVITKAGGASVNEIVAMKKPMIIYDIIPGQETPNARFVEQMGFGYIEKSTKGLVERVEFLFSDSDYARLAKNLNDYHLNDDSAEKIARFLNTQLRK